MRKLLLRGFQSDLLYWGVTQLFKKPLVDVMGVNDTVVSRLSEAQLNLTNSFIDYMHRVPLRSAGALFDNVSARPGDRIAAIRAPTLIIHAKDDPLVLYDNVDVG